MKQILLLVLVTFASMYSFATPPSDSSDDILIAYSKTNQVTHFNHAKTIEYKNQTIVIYLEVTKEGETQSIGISNNISQKDFESFKSYLEEDEGSTCFTRCTLKRGCNDKPTTAGVISCNSGCAIDCIAGYFGGDNGDDEEEEVDDSEE